MTRLRHLAGTSTTRAAAALVAAMIVLVPNAPSAWADPAGDADGAISAAWDAGGGAAGPLGVKDGGVYPVGAGFGQNLAGGRIYFTPDTGAHIMTGAILDKYLSLGGPGDGDLGFPDIDEGAGRAANSRNTTFSAVDDPVIFWTPDTGAHVVRGALNAAWDKLGGSAGVLGVPSDDESYRGDDVTQTFTGGQLTWNRKTGVFTSTPPELAPQLAGLAVPGDATTAIAAARRAAGGAMGPLGAPDGAQFQIGDNAVGQNYAGGTIFYSPETGANVVTGQILAKYRSVGGPEGDLGLPTSSEGDGGLAPSSSVVPFAAPDQPVIFWTPDFGAVIVRGAMNAAWTKLGGATGALGPPTADQSESGDVVTQKFSGGAISWYRSTNEFSTEPGALASQLAGLEIPGLTSLPEAPPAAEAPAASADKWYQWHRWWLLAIVPVALLVAAIVIAVVLNRRRRDHHDRSPMDDFDDDFIDRGDDDDDDDDDFNDFDDAHLSTHRDFDAGPQLDDDTDDETSRYAAASMWAVPAGRSAATPEGNGGTDSGSAAGRTADAEHFFAEHFFAEDEDAIDTAPTRVVPDPDEDRDAEPTASAAEPARQAPPVDDVDHEPASGRHAAVKLTETTATQMAFRLAGDDQFTAPDGYPIKADTTSGLYLLPSSSRYDQARAEIWFASEEFAITNGFEKG